MEQERPQARKSNIELLRIVLMLLIIAHHYVVSSGVMEQFDYQHLTWRMLFLQCFGAFGKIGVNCFILITGYFMVTSRITMKKWLKLYLEVKFYTIVIYLVFLAFGRASFNYHECLETLFSVVFGMGNTYADTFLILYLLIPFLNALVNQLDFKAYSGMLIILLGVFTVVPSFSLFLSVMRTSNDTWNYLAWMLVVYLIGAFMRLHQERLPVFSLAASKKFALFALNVFLIFLWIGFYDLFGSKHDMGSAYWFINDANKLLALTCAVSMLIWFLSIEVKNSKWINGIAATTFGVFLIHTSGNYMREFLWGSVFQVESAYQKPHIVLVAFLSVLAVFVFGACIDYLRIRFLEKPLFSLLQQKKC